MKDAEAMGLANRTWTGMMDDPFGEGVFTPPMLSVNSRSGRKFLAG
jgi:hypothetical protein